MLGQSMYNWRAQAPNGPITTKPNLITRIADMKWTPIKKLSNEEYEDLLREKMLRIDAEIKVIDDKIDALRSTSLATKDEKRENDN